MKKSSKIFAGILLAATVFSTGIGLLAPTKASAQSYYKRTRTTKIATKPVIVNQPQRSTYKANGNINRWTFKKNHALVNYPMTGWVATQKTYITMNGKKVLYYWINNRKKHVSGWVYSGALKNSYQRTKTVPVTKKEYYTVNKTSQTFLANGDLNNWVFRANHQLKNMTAVTWTTTQKTYITINGKKRLYYWVHPSNGASAGWIWSGYLKAGKNKQITDLEKITSKNMILAKAGSVYQLDWNSKIVYFRNPKPLSSTENYKVTQKAVIYKQGKPYTYYYVSGDKKTKGWVWEGFVKEGTYVFVPSQSIEKSIATNTKGDEYSINDYLKVLVNQYRVENGLTSLDTYDGDSIGTYASDLVSSQVSFEQAKRVLEFYGKGANVSNEYINYTSYSPYVDADIKSFMNQNAKSVAEINKKGTNLEMAQQILSILKTKVNDKLLSKEATGMYVYTLATSVQPANLLAKWTPVEISTVLVKK